MTSPKPDIATNRGDATVSDALGGYWQHLLDTNKEAPALALATAYFNPGGFGLLADQLERASSVRLLLGAEPDVAADMRRLRQLRKDTLPTQDSRRRVREALRSHAADMATDRNLVHFDRENDARIQRMLDWLRSGKIEVRRLEDRFLHGKAFVVESHDGVLAGSSNLTYAGLRTNVELNLGQYQPHVVGEVMAWYDELWDEAVEYDLAGLYEQRFAEWDPYTVFLRMLWERYRDELHEDPEPPGLDLTAFQRDGLYRAIDFLRRHKGVLIADGVGLGKTYLAGELIRQAVEDRRQRVLLVAPASLRDGPWEHFLRQHDLKNVQAVSYEQLATDPRLGGDRPRPVLWHDPDDYAMVVIDEAHAYRNTDTNRSATLRQLLKGSPQKDLVLLTATPVNNSLWDLYNLLAYFVRNDAKFLDAGIPSLRSHFAEASTEDPEDLTPDKLFDVLDAVAVRRTRRFVKKFYPHETVRRDGEEIPIAFPQPIVHRVDYDLEQALPGFFAQFAHALGMDPSDPTTPIPENPADFVYGEQLTLARYAPSTFLADDDPEAYELQAAGLLRSGLLKRFESSAYAFANTCRTMARSHDSFLAALDDGWVLTGDSLAAWERTDTDEFDPATIAADVGGTRESANLYQQDDLRAAVAADRDMLVAFAERAESIHNADDPKLDALVEELAAIASEAAAGGVGDADTRDRRKVLVFSYYADTVDWIVQRLETATRDDPRVIDYLNRITFVSGSGGDKEDAMWGFAPRSADAPDGTQDAYDCLVATDVLAEGVNLQQARHIINYDLPWNPMRLVQRHGRIDRIGSPHDRVHLRCFFPAALLDELLGLESALQRKIAQAAAAVGVEDEIIPGSRRGEIVYHHTKDQIEALRDEDPSLFENAEEAGALSGEEFRRELADRMADSGWRDKVTGLPWVAGSGHAVGGPGGFVFCARVGDHERPVYRHVPLTEGGDLNLDEMTGDTLTALARASCEPATPRLVPDDARELAYDAWEAARQHIVDRWLEEADPRAVSRPVPKPMRDAAMLLREHPPEDMAIEKQHRILDAIEAPYDNRTQRMMRQAFNSSDTQEGRVQAVVALVDELALEVPASADPLPEIDENDVHLVCWMALVGDGSSGVRSFDGGT